MKKLRAAPANAMLPRKKTEPRIEGIRKRRPYGFFSKMSDDGLVEFAQEYVGENGIESRKGLQKTGGAL
ncbi:hypothetical protein GF318_02890 [Candidatus Micrarchaeota archaeon]|nr:hypothetical protein [Candidatus Micrarchaeota archaeon]